MTTGTHVIRQAAKRILAGRASLAGQPLHHTHPEVCPLVPGISMLRDSLECIILVSRTAR